MSVAFALACIKSANNYPSLYIGEEIYEKGNLEFSENNSFFGQKKIPFVFCRKVCLSFVSHWFYQETKFSRGDHSLDLLLILSLDELRVQCHPISYLLHIFVFLLCCYLLLFHLSLHIFSYYIQPEFT